MGLDNENREIMIDLYWKKSINTLKEADDAIQCKNWSNSAGRIYYSVFYAICSLFIKDGHPINSHRGAKSVLYLQYVSKGLIDNKFSSLFAKLETLRDKADYNVFFEASEEDVMKFRPQVDDFLEIIKDLKDRKIDR